MVLNSRGATYFVFSHSFHIGMEPMLLMLSIVNETTQSVLKDKLRKGGGAVVEKRVFRDLLEALFIP